MKRALVAAAAVLLVIGLGIALGVGLGRWEVPDAADDFAALETAETGPTVSVPVGAPRPKVAVVGSREYDFGVMDRNTTRSHTFVLRNEGEGPLKLTEGGTTCSCTISKLAEGEIPPGGTADVVVQWTSTGYDTQFRHSAAIRTNDPDRPTVTLSVFGRVTQIVRPVPDSVSFSDKSADQARTVYFDVYAYRDASFEITKCELTDRETAGHFDVTVRPLSPAEVHKEPDAVRGYRISVTAKPGLPLGPIHQTIRLATNVPDAEQLMIPVGGRVTGDISVVAVDVPYDAQRNFLKVGPVKSDRGRIVQMLVLVKGPHRGDVMLRVGPVTPDVLRVTIGKPAPVGKVVKFPVEIEIPRGSPPMDYLGTKRGEVGKIVLETTHPSARQLPIFVRFAVE